MPALGMAQDKGRLLRWLVAPGATVTKGDPLMEVETDKTTVEIEAPASGILSRVTAAPGDDVPVTQVIAVILAPGETALPEAVPGHGQPPVQASRPPLTASPLATRIASDRGIDLRAVAALGDRIEKSDVLAHIAALERARDGPAGGRILASPKARRLAAEAGLSLDSLRGTGPQGAILTLDVRSAATMPQPAGRGVAFAPEPPPAGRADRTARWNRSAPCGG